MSTDNILNIDTEVLSTYPGIHALMQLPTVLAARLAKDQMYTRIGSRVLVALRPQRALATNSDAASKEFAERGSKTESNMYEAFDNSTKEYSQIARNSKTAEAEAPPHVFDIAASAYWHCIREAADQSIVLLYFHHLILGSRM
jgi:myosin heavy subunit